MLGIKLSYHGLPSCYLLWLPCGQASRFLPGASGLRSVSPFSVRLHYVAIALGTSLPGFFLTVVSTRILCAYPQLTPHHGESDGEIRLPHKAIRHLCLTFDTQFPWIVGKKSKRPLPQFLQHECLSADPRPTRPLRMSSLGANLCAYLAGSAPHDLANVKLHCGTASIDSEEACCGW